jgi:hypothetical protein
VLFDGLSVFVPGLLEDAGDCVEIESVPALPLLPPPPHEASSTAAHATDNVER